MKKIKYIAKPNTTFDEGTEAKLIEDYRYNENTPMYAGLFVGYVKGVLDEETVSFDSFEIIEVEI
jgi:hypothetical protein